MSQIPDFSKMTEDELMKFWSRYHRASRKDAEALIGDRRPGYTNIAAKLANYACNKACVMSCKKRGDEVGAEIYEYNANLCYESLPNDLAYLVCSAKWKAK